MPGTTTEPELPLPPPPEGDPFAEKPNRWAIGCVTSIVVVVLLYAGCAIFLDTTETYCYGSEGENIFKQAVRDKLSDPDGLRVRILSSWKVEEYEGRYSYIAEALTENTSGTTTTLRVAGYLQEQENGCAATILATG